MCKQQLSTSMKMIIFLMLLYASINAKYVNSWTFDVVTHCPLTQLKWRDRAVQRKCTTHKSYHCLRMRNGQLVELCTRRTALNPEDGCPFIDIGSFTITNYTTCKESKGCPITTDEFYASDKLYQYIQASIAAPHRELKHVLKYLSCKMEIGCAFSRRNSSGSQIAVQATGMKETSTGYRDLNQFSVVYLSRPSLHHEATLVVYQSKREKENTISSFGVYGFISGGIIVFLICLMIILLIMASLVRNKSSRINVEAEENSVAENAVDEEESHYDYVDAADINGTECFEAMEMTGLRQQCRLEMQLIRT